VFDLPRDRFIQGSPCNSSGAGFNSGGLSSPQHATGLWRGPGYPGPGYPGSTVWPFSTCCFFVSSGMMPQACQNGLSFFLSCAPMFACPSVTIFGHNAMMDNMADFVSHNDRRKCCCGERHSRTRNELECAATCITIDAAATHRHKFLLDCIEVLVRCAGTPKGVDGTGSGKFVASLGPELALNLIYAKLRESLRQCI
jgi:hypothetical protein